MAHEDTEQDLYARWGTGAADLGRLAGLSADDAAQNLKANLQELARATQWQPDLTGDRGSATLLIT